MRKELIVISLSLLAIFMGLTIPDVVADGKWERYSLNRCMELALNKSLDCQVIISKVDSFGSTSGFGYSKGFVCNAEHCNQIKLEKPDTISMKCLRFSHYSVSTEYRIGECDFK